MAAPKEIADLVERFESNKESYKSGRYNEAQVGMEFVDPFFKALGWDIDNEQGFAEAYKGVIPGAKVGGTTRAPDYSFRIGGQRKFFLETWKPSDAISLSAKKNVASQDHYHMVSLVDSMLSLQKLLQEARTPRQQTALQRQIEAHRPPDRCPGLRVYGLTEEVIRIAEGK